MRIATKGSPATVLVALTAPLNRNATAENSAARLGGSRPVRARTIGSATQGSTAVGSTSALRTPTWLSTRALSPNAIPATQAGHTSSPIARATRRAPSQPITSTSTDHSRSVTQGATCRPSRTTKNGPCGKR